MKIMRFFEPKETVFIKMEVVNAVLDGGDIKYQLRDPLTGRCGEYRYTANDMYFLEQNPNPEEGVTDGNDNRQTESESNNI